MKITVDRDDDFAPLIIDNSEYESLSQVQKIKIHQKIFFHFLDYGLIRGNIIDLVRYYGKDNPNKTLTIEI